MITKLMGIDFTPSPHLYSSRATRSHAAIHGVLRACDDSRGEMWSVINRSMQDSLNPSLLPLPPPYHPPCDTDTQLGQWGKGAAPLSLYSIRWACRLHPTPH